MAASKRRLRDTATMVVISLAGAVLLQVPAARAQADDRPWNRGVSQGRREAARAIFLEGNRLLQVPHFGRAADKYKEALALWQHPAFYYNLALAQFNLVQFLEAYESFERALRYGSAPLGQKRYEQALEYQGRLKKQLAYIEVACDEDGAEVSLDGRLLFTGPLRYTGMVMPGNHQIVASKPGRIPEARQLNLSPGESVQVELVLRFPDHVETERYLPSWAPWASMAVGAALVSTAGYLDWRSSRDIAAFDQDFNRLCQRWCFESEVPELTHRLRRAESQKRAALALYITGGALSVGSIALLYINRERIVRSRERGANVTVTPLIAPGAAGVIAGLRF